MKKSWMRKALSLFLATLMLMALVACGGDSGGNTGDGQPVDNSGRTDVNYGLTSDIASLDPVYTTDQISTILYRQMYDTLIVKDENGEWAPKLAESWELSDDEMTYTFHLRDDVVFHDGSKMTAEDVAYSINRAIESAAVGASMTNMKECMVIDDYTVEVHMISPFAGVYEILSTYGRVSSAKTTDYESAPIGTGPYKFVSRNSGDSIKLEAFDQYYLGEATIKDLTFKIITDPTTQIAALQKGEIDFLTHCSLSAKATVEGDSNLVWQESLFRGNNWLSFCQNKPPFDNILARKAAQYAIDKDAVLVGGSEGLGITMKTVFPSSVPNSPEEDYEQPYSYDVEKAKEYLEQYKKEAGVDSVDITILAPDTAMYLYPAITVEGMLREVGFNVTTEQIDRSTYWSSVYAGSYQLAVTGTSWPVNDCDGNYLYFYSTSGQHYFMAFNDELDEYLDLGRSTSDPDARKEAYTHVQEIIDEEAICVPLLQPAIAVAYSSSLKGVDTTDDIYAHFVYDWSW